MCLETKSAHTTNNSESPDREKFPIQKKITVKHIIDQEKLSPIQSEMLMN